MSDYGLFISISRFEGDPFAGDPEQVRCLVDGIIGHDLSWQDAHDALDKAQAWAHEVEHGAAAVKVIKCEAIKRDGSTWATYTFPVEGHRLAVEDIEAEMHRFADTVRKAVREANVKLAYHPLRFTEKEMEREEYDSIVIHAGQGGAWDELVRGRREP